MNYLKKFLLFANGEKLQLVAAFFCATLLVWGLSCESKVSSLLIPNTRVTRMELQAELDLIIARAGNRFKSLDQQDAFKIFMFDNLSTYASTGGVNVAGMIQMAVSILGIGAIADNVAKRRKIKKLNNAG